MPPFSPRDIYRRIRRHWSRKTLPDRKPPDRPYRVGWIVADTLSGGPGDFSNLAPPSSMRVSQIANWLNEQDTLIHNEMYVPDRTYDVVLFVKAMDETCQRELERIRGYGGVTVFDANVNYYESWGEFDIPGTRPTDTLRDMALWMTREANWIVADSTYLKEIIEPINKRVTVVPDNVDMNVYGTVKNHQSKDHVRLVWSGVAKKAVHLTLITEAFQAFENLELVLVSDEEPPVQKILEPHIPCRFIRFSESSYAQALKDCDIIISPKRLNNSYAMAHTEYKITLGMATGLPAIASPQKSYVEAIGYKGGGCIAASTSEWVDALKMLSTDHHKRKDLGQRAHETVRDHYSTAVIARRYGDLIVTLIKDRESRAAAR